ncbi:hypothetical protein A2344_00400 [Candidatus Peregrinibacteria bacterium RIFOXYB12_FULL_41_12]|nr:MAG: hypothetical protein A2244_03860 [Candidatus Peregrinibacteria bacterium RIFOXYA2_FULL_41_18]OGJ49475.1 MAG: hypothetical protein A2344_00400 [Candidatus Peregrinibacteria bacterium RIFOXYB12_FULL_41_12]OGJ53348.1 MAG: hypothetical protein A2448_03375 [Candidatus Peregrinibacteria bacterium RIFOXYC2_FULL_41_22]OGJ54347.1 MAG: hypothetical protein A2336_04320 [Candidatus Peregrinibacteria bacterium RIFOXYB2_FULL_41_88]
MADMKMVKRLDISSVAKLQATMMAVMYGIMGALTTLGGVFALLFGQGFNLIGMGLGMLILGAAFGYIIGYIGGALGAWIYNMLAAKVGGIKIELE